MRSITRTALGAFKSNLIGQCQEAGTATGTTATTRATSKKLPLY